MVLLTTAESAATVTRERRPVIHRVPSIANLLLFYPSAEYWLVRKAFHWVRESLDTTYHAIIGLQELDELTGEGYLRDFLAKDQNFHKIRRFLIWHVDDNTKGVRHSSQAVPSLYGTHLAIHLAKRLLNINGSVRKMFGQPIGWRRLCEFFESENRVRGIYEFAIECMRGTNTFYETPYEIEASVADVHAEVTMINELEKDCPYREAIEEKYGHIKNFLINRCLKRDVYGNLGFSNYPSEPEPFLCSTYYAMSVLNRMGRLNEFLRTHQGSDTKRFINACQSGNGGYAIKVDSERPTISKTDLALKVYRFFYYFDDPGRAKVELGLDKILQYVKESYADCGFVFMKGLPKDVFNTRRGIGVLMKLADFYGDEREKVIKAININEIRNFIMNDCYNKDKGGFSGFKIGSIR